MVTQADKARRFQALHERGGAFVIPNPWDPGSAKLLAGLGFEALATTSAGAANALGRLDGALSRAEVIAHCRALCAATDLPVSADLENGFGDEPDDAAETIRLAADAGLVGGSIEDYSGDPARPIYALEHAVERIQAAAEAARALDFPFCLTARAENLIRGGQGIEDTIRRLQAYAAAGADVVYAPGLTTLHEVREVTAAVEVPVNVLAPLVKAATVTTLAEAGAKRLSVGGALARAAITALLRAGAEMGEQGSFTWSMDLAAGAEVSRLMAS